MGVKILSNIEKQKEIEEKIIKLNKRKEKKAKNLVNTNQEKAFEKSIELFEDGMNYCINNHYYSKVL